MSRDGRYPSVSLEHSRTRVTAEGRTRTDEWERSSIRRYYAVGTYNAENDHITSALHLWSEAADYRFVRARYSKIHHGRRADSLVSFSQPRNTIISELDR